MISLHAFHQQFKLVVFMGTVGVIYASVVGTSAGITSFVKYCSFAFGLVCVIAVLFVLHARANLEVRDIRRVPEDIEDYIKHVSDRPWGYVGYDYDDYHADTGGSSNVFKMGNGEHVVFRACPSYPFYPTGPATYQDAHILEVQITQEMSHIVSITVTVGYDKVVVLTQTFMASKTSVSDDDPEGLDDGHKEVTVEPYLNFT